LLCLYINWN